MHRSEERLMDTELLLVPRRSLHSSCAINLKDGRRDGWKEGSRDGRREMGAVLVG